MPEQGSAHLIRACEALCEDLREAVGLTAFTIALERGSTAPLVIALRGPEVVVHPAQRHDPRAPARMEIPLQDGGSVVASVTIEDGRRAAYTDEDRGAGARIVASYAPEIAALVRSVV